MKKLLVLLFLLFSVDTYAAIIYIDPTCGNNGDGTAGSPCAASGGGVGPRNTWAGVTWTAGNTYAGQGNTTAQACLAPNADGSNGSPITITSYGNGQATINCVGSQPVRLVNRAWITVNNIKVTTPDAHCMFIDKSTDIIISNNTINSCHTTVGHGIFIEGQAIDSNIDRLSITGNTISGLAGGCIIMGEVPNTNSSVFDSISITNNVCNGNATLTTQGAIEITVTNGSTATFTNLTISGNTITNHNKGQADTVSSVLRVIRSGGSSHEDIFKGVVISNNTITDSSHGIGINNTAALEGVKNCVCNNTLININGNTAIGAFWTNALYLEGNVIVGVVPGSSGIDGTGFDIEVSTAAFPNNTVVRGNYVYNNLGSTLGNSGQGIYVVSSSFVEVVGNVLVGNKHGLFIDGSGASPNIVSNNTVVNSLVDGIRASMFTTQVHTMSNNIVVGSGGYGINDMGVSDQILTKNVFFGNRLGNYNSITPGASDITSDPLLTPTYRLSPTSPARRAGTWYQQCRDVRLRPCWVPPDIGAYQTSSGDPATTRTVIAPRTPR